MGVVLIITVLVDLISAVGVGIVLASLLFVKRMADLELANLRVISEPTQEIPFHPEEKVILERNNGRIVLIHVDGPMSFGSAKNMVRRLESLKGFNKFTHVVLDLTDVSTIDGTAALAVEDMLRMVQSHHQNLYFVGIKPGVLNVLDGLGVLKYIKPEQRYDLRLDALRHADQDGKPSLTDGLTEAPQPEIPLPHS
jgi:SulP family sulfate permease